MSHWIYHPERDAKIVSSSEYPIFLREGWYDSPSKFPSKSINSGNDGLGSNESLKKKRGRPKRSEEINDNTS